MANFQIGHSKLFPDGAQLFASGKSGAEKRIQGRGALVGRALAAVERKCVEENTRLHG